MLTRCAQDLFDVLTESTVVPEELARRHCVSTVAGLRFMHRDDGPLQALEKSAFIRKYVIFNPYQMYIKIIIKN